MNPLTLEVGLLALRSIGLLMAMLVLVWSFSQWRRSQERDAARLFEQMDVMRAELLMLSDRLEQLQQVAPRHVTTEVQVKAAPAAPVPMPASPRGYEVAARLARSGATRDELISSCGLSRNEAELLLRLHGQARDTKANMHAPTAKTADNDLRRARLSVVG